MKRLKSGLNLVKNMLVFIYVMTVSIINIIGFLFLFTAPLFIALMVVRDFPPLLGNPLCNLTIAFVIDIVWLAVLVYIILPLYEHIRDKNFREMAGAIVAYEARKWKAKLGKVDEIEDE